MELIHIVCSGPWIKGEQMLLLHLSDIHFKSPDCLDPKLDPNKPIRTYMLRDIENKISKLGGSADAILISGDVAFKGVEEEYSTAATWIGDLCSAANCSRERVFVVPGNHDVNRDTTRNQTTTKNAQAAIIDASNNAREGVFKEQILDSGSGYALTIPLASYNKFAANYSCQVYLPNRIKWVQDLDLEYGVKLRIHGLTSTLLSGFSGKDDQRAQLYLSPMQTAFDPNPNVIHLVLCHHPPDWLVDQDDVEDAMKGAVAIQMFGHKHRQRLDREVSYVRFGAGAVNPDRSETGWSPSYNLVELSLEGEGDNRLLGLRAHLREWQSNPPRYRGKQTENGNEVFQHSISFPARSYSSRLDGTSVEGACSTSALQDAMVSSEELSKEAAMGNITTRNLVFRFWSLRRSEQRQILENLGLVRENEANQLEAEKYGRALMRASEEGLLEDLAREVEKKETSH